MQGLTFIQHVLVFSVWNSMDLESIVWDRAWREHDTTYSPFQARLRTGFGYKLSGLY